MPETRQPQDWPPLINYITDAVSDGARVDFVRVTNLPSVELRDAVLAMMITQDMNTRSKTDKTYHMIFSFPHGEKPSREILNDIEDNLVASIGLKEHQRISAAHDDKDHYHVHIAINKVHPKTFHNVEPFYDKNALMRTCAKLEKKHGLMITNHGELAQSQSANRAPDFEIHCAKESLQSWIKSNSREQLIEAFETSKSWDEFHDEANELGLEFKLRGAGIVIEAVGQEVSVKASSIDRMLSLKSLSDKFGLFQASRVTYNVEAVNPMPGAAKLQNADTGALYARYQAQKNEAIASRRTLKEDCHQRREEAAKIIKNAFLNKRQLIKNNRLLGRMGKKIEYQKLKLERTKIWQIHKNIYAAETRKIEKSNPIQSWTEFLKKEANFGNDEGLAALRKNEKSKEALKANILDCVDMASAKNIVMRNLSPIVRRNGDILYLAKDGGKVIDSNSNVRVEKVSSGSALLALSLALEKYQGEDLRINGSDEFKREIVLIAASKDLKIRFVDKVLNDAVDILKSEMSKSKGQELNSEENQIKVAKQKSKPRKHTR